MSANPNEYLYHWTHFVNFESIADIGLDPSYAEGKLCVVWVCEHNRIGWAMSHIAARHGWNPDDMVLIRIRRKDVSWTATAYPGVYTTTRKIVPSRFRGLKINLLEKFTPFGVLPPDRDTHGRIGRDTRPQRS